MKSSRSRTPFLRFTVALGALLAVFAVAFAPAAAQAQEEVTSAEEKVRTRYTINSGWAFHPGGLAFGQRSWYAGAPTHFAEDWERVSIPHTWNARDPFEEPESYRRGISWYRKEIFLPERMEGKKLFLHFEGVNQEADVYVNGAFAGRHVGGYTAFTIDITEQANPGGENTVAVQVDNSHDTRVAPLSVGYALYGGIYRDVWLVATNEVHLSTSHGASGVYVHTPSVSEEEATVAVESRVVNESEEAQPVRVVHTVVDSGGQTVATFSSDEQRVAAGAEVKLTARGEAIADPRLWAPEHPYLYGVVTQVEVGGEVVDRVESPLGFRWYRFDAEEGFILNGEPYQIKGTNRHQDYKGIGPALSNRQHVRDLEWIKNMGTNFVRLAHYPQDPAVLDAADRLGLLVWEEIPLVNYVNRSKGFVENTRQMAREMVRQHRNHPSVVIWGAANEILLWGERGARTGAKRLKENPSYLRFVRRTVAAVDSVLRAESGPSQYTGMAMHQSGIYRTAGIDALTQIQGWNLYPGWYFGEVGMLGDWLDARRAEEPQRPVFITEYGAGGDVRLNGVDPERFDFTGQWLRYYHESYLRQIQARPWLAGTAIWNQFDFSQPFTGGSIPHRNQKGMQTWDRQPKDVYYLYKANWNPEPMVYIASHDWTRRAGTPEEAASQGEPVAVEQPVEVYSNLERVELFHNGESLGVKQPDDVQSATWQVPFTPGENTFEARAPSGGNASGPTDRLTIDFTLVPRDLRADGDSVATPREMAVNVGYNAQFAPKRGGTIWLPDQPYREGSYGYVGGESEAGMMDRSLVVERKKRLAPLYGYYRTGLEAYRFDVPDGRYTVELHFSEPTQYETGRRVFDVRVNGQRVFEEALDPTAEFGFLTPASRSFRVKVTGGEGIEVTFDERTGASLLSAIRVVRR